MVEIPINPVPYVAGARRAFSRQRRLVLVASGSAALLAIFGACGKPPELAPGQVWSYNTRAGEGASTVQILHIEPGTPLGDVFFVSVRALHVKRGGGKLWAAEIWPVVFTRDALARSLTTYQYSEPIKRPFLRQLDVWNLAARNGKADERTFAVTVGEALNEIEAERGGAAKRRFAET